jgi:predicted O-methyltransferase YrrM
MYNRFELASRYLKYFFGASNGKGHGIHSPFIFDFVVNVLQNKKLNSLQFGKIEVLRKFLKKSNQVLEVKDLGAGSGLNNSRSRTVSSIAKSAAKPAKYSQLLYRIAVYYKVDSILELGTSLGLTTRYLSLANPTNGVVTIEGAPNIASYAEEKFKEAGINNIELLVGDFSERLNGALLGLKGHKMIFFDGNHQYQSTMDYFRAALKVCGDQDILIFDDIHWSNEMEKAWKEIKKSEQVRCTIDLFFIGIVFFRKEFKEKLDFAIRF